MIGKVAAAGGLAFAAAAVAPLGVDDIPPVALSAYVAAAANAPCAIDWQTLAAVGSVESHHGAGTLDDNGTTTRIIGSSEGARGPMQFLPSTFRAYADPGADIDNVWDAATAAARLLCANSIEGDWDNAVGAYNGGPGWRSYGESREYVRQVTAAHARYAGIDPRLLPPATTAPTALARVDTQSHNEVATPQNDTTTTTTTTAPPERDASALWDAVMRGWVRLGQLLDRVGLGAVWSRADRAMFAPAPKMPTIRRAVAPTPSGLDPTFATKLNALIAAAPGAITVSSGHRTADEQWDLRVKNCPDAINSDSTECTPWTAKVGSSPHEAGLAADLDYADDATESWAHDNAARFGLRFPMANEPWHVEPQ